jgi:Porin PorA
MRKLSSVAAVVLGLVLIAGAGVVRWTAPSQVVLPADTNSTRTYTGTAATLFNASALTTPGAPVLLKNVPITTTHTTKVLDTNGSNALISDAGKLLVAGSPVGSFDYRYAVNRTSMDRGSGYKDVVAQTGITFNWPIRTAKHDYVGWVSDTQSTTPLVYAGTAKRGGLSTYMFTATVAAAPLTDPATLKELPQSLPKATLVNLAGGLGLDATKLGALAQALPLLADPVPFSYTYAMTATYWVQPGSGEVVDVQERETRTLGIKIGANVVPVTPVMDISYTSSPAQLATSVKEARHDGNLVTLVYETLPRGLGIAGVALFLVGIVGLVVLRRRPGSGGGGPAQVDPQHDLEPVGTGS